jgi:hypothetical protein
MPLTQLCCAWARDATNPLVNISLYVQFLCMARFVS